MASNKYMTVDQLAERWMCSPSPFVPCSGAVSCQQ